jgi:hypothetical protein
MYISKVILVVSSVNQFIFNFSEHDVVKLGEAANTTNDSLNA